MQNETDLDCRIALKTETCACTTMVLNETLELLCMNESIQQHLIMVNLSQYRDKYRAQMETL